MPKRKPTPPGPPPEKCLDVIEQAVRNMCTGTCVTLNYVSLPVIVQLLHAAFPEECDRLIMCRRIVRERSVWLPSNIQIECATCGRMPHSSLRKVRVGEEKPN